MTEVNYLAVILATIAQFIVGAIWYMPIFGKLWGKIHGFDQHSKKEQDEARSKMMPLLIAQFLFTLVTTFVFAKLILLMPYESLYKIALMLWVGFVVPTQAAAVIFGGTDPKWIVKKSAIMAGGSLACLLVAAAILGAIK